MRKININIDMSANTRPLTHIWSKCVGAGRAAEGLRADWQAQLKRTVNDCGFEYIRFHGLLSDDMGIVHRKEDGSLGFNFAYVDALFDALIEMKIRPFVEFGFMPSALASGTQTQFWWKANITPPKKIDEWGKLIHALITHWQERYGKQETQKWYYEVWNEPNLSGFWTGTKSEYFELYKVTANTIKAVDNNLRVGGPATSNFVPDARFETEREDTEKQKTNFVEDIDTLSWRGVWISDFLNYCKEQNLPVDFVSTHPYPTDFALDTQKNMQGKSRKKEAVQEDLAWLQDVVRNSAYPNAQIHLTEWSSSPTSRDCAHDFLPAACYVVKSNLDCAALTDSLSYWVFTDIFEEAGPAPSVFHGGFGMQTINGIQKPTYHAYRMLHKLGDKILHKADNFIATVTKQNKLNALVYNYPQDVKTTVPMSVYPNRNIAIETQNTQSSLTAHINITGLAPNAQITATYLSKNSGSAALQWVDMGAPDSLTSEQYKQLNKMAQVLKTRVFSADSHGNLSEVIELEAWEIIMFSEI